MTARLVRQTALAALIGTSALAASPRVALACGGFFCSQAQPVNQAAERIIFSNNGDGTVTAVIQILYEGPSESFSWLLPLPSVPEAGSDIAVASDDAFRRLQQATNPQYNLNRRVEGRCRSSGIFGTPNADGASAVPGQAAQGPRDLSGGVSVAASGVVGAFDWTALAFDPGLDDPASAALTWLTENGYDVLPNSAELIRPYLASGMYLLALKLTKGQDTGAIRPIVLRYEGDLPSIPIKLTAVAANEDMGVMTWVLSDARSVPFNYSALELNEARINWFNASSNYDAVVTAAADDAGGQGFVTEFADASSSLAGVVWSPGEEQQWQSFRTQTFSSFDELFLTAYSNFGSYDGFSDAVRDTVQFPEGVSQADFESCPYCNQTMGVRFSPTEFYAAIEESVVQPLRLVQELIDQQPYVTRMYSTLSASEMTVDPVFTFNPELPPVSNVHLADWVIECGPAVFESEAPWRIELPSGGVVRGDGSTAGTWAPALDAQPANKRILTLAETGEGAVLLDNTTEIDAALASYNASFAAVLPGGDPFVPGSSTLPTLGQSTDATGAGSGSACAVSRRSAPLSLFPIGATFLGLLGALSWRRQRRSAGTRAGSTR